ncbi:DUF3298 and DUF4163 domain-containing protein [Xanthomarina sp. F2636L]|uniref:DUF3298 and DUF4163 domain-containing protein n=1 Tax=Xanthomarina sp. F2636L TaxID=2996018 RepID=UPI00225E01E9|nr:DUF3298 and DUF4163 domain-containing protein [Xanthomarina sp. F2636L]MCX7551147.1 DUF3298 and DUF4163 domain-containing protein [Xanthomarina sp. F2636L]
MRYKIFIYAIIISLISQTCKEEKTVEFKEISKTTNTNTLVEINIPEASGNDDISKAINHSIEQHIIASLNVKDANNHLPKTIEESIDVFNNEYTTFKNDFSDSVLSWEAQIDGEVMYQSPDIISMAITTYLNTGGAHGNLSISFLNFNAQTGKQLKNEDLLEDHLAFIEIAKTYFDEEIADKKELYFEPENFKLPENIGFSEEGVILLYNTYEIAPYSSGITEIQIPWQDLQTSLNYL